MIKKETKWRSEQLIRGTPRPGREVVKTSYTPSRHWHQHMIDHECSPSSRFSSGLRRSSDFPAYFLWPTISFLLHLSFSLLPSPIMGQITNLSLVIVIESFEWSDQAIFHVIFWDNRAFFFFQTRVSALLVITPPSLVGLKYFLTDSGDVWVI